MKTTNIVRGRSVRANERGPHRLVIIMRASGIITFVAAVSVFPVLAWDRQLLTLPIMIHASLLFLGSFAVAYAGRAANSIGVFVFLALEALRGCVVPILLQIVGQSPSVFRPLGSWTDAATVLYFGNLFLAGFIFASFLISASRGQKPVTSNFLSQATSRGVILATIMLGAFGFVLRFPSFAHIWGFITANYDDLQTATEGGLSGFISAILRPLLPLGFALLVVRSREQHVRTDIVVWPALLVSVYFGLGSYGLNRATIIVPIAAFLIAYLGHFKVRLGFTRVAVLLLAAGGSFLFLGSFRKDIYADRIGQNGLAENNLLDSAVQTLLLYGQSPLQSAPALHASKNQTGLWNFDSLLASFVSPVPGIADSLRRASGTAIYNSVLYRNSTTKDQILPSWLEGGLTFGVAGALLLGICVAFVLVRLDLRSAVSSTFVGKYSIALSALIVAQISISSISATVQSLIYFALLPAILTTLFNKHDERSRQL